MLAALGQERRPWRGELALLLDGGQTLPVAVRAEVVPARDGSVLGFFLILIDLTDTQRATGARRRLEQSLSDAGDEPAERDPPPAGGATVPGDRSDVLGAILAHASLAAMDIADDNNMPGVAPLLEELEASTRRASELYDRMRLFGS